MNIEELPKKRWMKIGSLTSSYINQFYFRFFVNFLLLILIWTIRFPHVFQKLYAEDGVTLLQGTYESSYFREFLSPIGGFSQLVARFGARFMRLFPIEYAPISAAIFTAGCIAFLSSLIFQYSEDYLKNTMHQALLSIFFLFIPIANFNSVGTICNLYFYFMVAAGVLLFSTHTGKQKKLSRKNLVIFLATLTNPLCLFLILLILGREYLNKRQSRRYKIEFSDTVWFLGIVLQFGFIFLFSFGKRVPHPPSSILSTLYLFFDRGLGSALIPNWGFVSGDYYNPVFENTLLMQNLYTRAMLSLFVFLLIILLIFLRTKHFGFEIALPPIILFSTALIFTLLIGISFSVEPRYMIFSSFFVFYAVLSLLGTLKFQHHEKVILGWFTVLIIASLAPSKYISEGPNWRTNFNLEKLACANESGKRTAGIQIMPLNGDWIVKIPCAELTK